MQQNNSNTWMAWHTTFTGFMNNPLKEINASKPKSELNSERRVGRNFAATHHSILALLVQRIRGMIGLVCEVFLVPTRLC
jgi:hypothetical protein